MMNYDDVVIMVHRGFTCNGHPENSLPAFQSVVEQGFKGVEFDVRISRDKKLFVFHDMKLEKLTSGGRGLVRTKHSRVLRKLKLRADQTCSIPLLDDVLAIFQPHPEILVNIEIKSESPVRGKIESRVLKKVYEFKMENQTVISSFNPLVLRTIRRIDKKIQTGFIYEKRLPKFHLKLAKSLPINSWHPNFRIISPVLMEESVKDNKTIMAWTLNEQADIEEALKLGVKILITDRPDVVREVLERLKGERSE